MADLAAAKPVTQLRYSEAEVEQIKVLFPDIDSLKLYRRYLLDLPLSATEIERVKALWSPVAVRGVLAKTTLPVIDGNEPIGVGYDLLNNISTSEPNFAHVVQRTELFVASIKWLNDRLNGLDTLATSCTGQGKWLTSAILGGSWPTDTNEQEKHTFAVLQQLVIKQNVEGILVGLNALVNTPTETPEQAAARLAADSAQ